MLLAFVAAWISLAWLVPNHYSPWVAAWNDACALSGLLLLMFWCVIRWQQAARITWPLLAFAGLCGATLVIQSITGQIVYFGDALLAGSYLALWLAAVATGQMIRAAPQGERVLDTLFGAWALAAILSVGLAIVQWTSALQLGNYLVDLAPTNRPFANIGQRNHFSTICFFGIGALGWLHERSRISTATLFAGAAFLMLGMIMSTSRTGWLQLGLLVVWLLAMRARTGLKASARQILGLGATFVALKLVWPAFANLMLLSADRTLEEQARSGLRLRHWDMMIDAIGREPWWGYGWQQVSVAQQRVALDHPAVGEQIESSHNFVLDLLLWNGVPIGLLIVAALGLWCAMRIRNCRDGRTAWLLLLTGGLFTHAMLEFPLEYAYFLVPLGLLMGAAEGASPAASALAVPRRAMLAAAGALAVLFAAIGFEYAQAEENNRMLRLESAHIGVDRIVTPSPGLRLLTQLEAYLAFGRTVEQPGMNTAELERMRLVSERYGYQHVMLRYALAAGLNGQADVAEKTLARICLLQPKNYCIQARRVWMLEVRSRYPQLKSIAVPSVPGT